MSDTEDNAPTIALPQWHLRRSTGNCELLPGVGKRFASFSVCCVCCAHVTMHYPPCWEAPADTHRPLLAFCVTHASDSIVDGQWQSVSFANDEWWQTVPLYVHRQTDTLLALCRVYFVRLTWTVRRGRLRRVVRCAIWACACALNVIALSCYSSQPSIISDEEPIRTCCASRR
jgi:hypothetical protein